MKKVLAIVTLWALAMLFALASMSSLAAQREFKIGNLKFENSHNQGAAMNTTATAQREFKIDNLKFENSHNQVAAMKATATAHGITYTWTASTSTYTGLGYNLYIGATAGGESATPANSALAAVGCSGAACTYTYSDVAAQSTYYAVLAACVPSGSASVCSAKTAEVAATIPLAAGDIAAPSGFSGSAF
jgi:hypothetical protein